MTAETTLSAASALEHTQRVIDEMFPKTLTREQLIAAQRDYCRRNNTMCFAPHSGNCYECGRDIVEPNWVDTLVTGCRFCQRSYCD